MPEALLGSLHTLPLSSLSDPSLGQVPSHCAGHTEGQSPFLTELRGWGHVTFTFKPQHLGRRFLNNVITSSLHHLLPDSLFSFTTSF